MDLLTYLLKVSACTVLFFSFYFLVLRKLTFFRINRFYLLVTLLLSFVIPALQFSVERVVDKHEVSIPVIASELPAYTAVKVQTVKATTVSMGKREVDWIALIPNAYFVITGVLIVFSTWQMCRLMIHARKYTKKEGGLKLIPKTIGFTNCSFFNYVFVNENSLSEQDLAVLLKHEEVHANQFHSIDKIVLVVCKAILWFNPIVYLFDKALEQTHEYEADDITSLNFGTGAYAKLLLKLAVSRNDVPLIHNFVKSPVKSRIKMLYNSKSGNMKKMVYLLTVPVVFGLFWLFSVDVVYAQRRLFKSAVTTPAKGFYEGKLTGRILSIQKDFTGFKFDFLADGKIYTITANGFNKKIKVGDELIVEISAKINHLSITDKSSKTIKKTNKPLYLPTKISTVGGILIYHKVLGENNYPANKKAVLLSDPNGVEVKNNSLYRQFYTEDIHQKLGHVKKSDTIFLTDVIRPKFISSDKITGNIQNKTSYYENAVVLIFSDLLRAKYVYYNQKTNVLIAKGATLEVKAGNKISAQQIIFDLNKNTYSTTNTENEKVDDTLGKSKFQKGFIGNKVSYSAIDSIKLTKDQKIITLFGNAKVFNNKHLLTGTKIVYNTQSGIAKAYNASYLVDGDNSNHKKVDTLSVKFY